MHILRSTIQKLLIFTLITFCSTSMADEPLEMLKDVVRTAKYIFNSDPDVSSPKIRKFEFDIETTSWDGSAIGLDINKLLNGYRSTGNSNAISWVISDPAYGSSVPAGEVIGVGDSITFQPDKPGVWGVTPKKGGRALRHPVSIKLYNLPKKHPRLFLNPEKIEKLKAKARAKTPAWKELKRIAESPQGGMLSKALVSVLTGDSKYCFQAEKEASEELKKLQKKKQLVGNNAGDLATYYDWCYPHLTQTQKNNYVQVFNQWGDRYIELASGLRGQRPDTPGLGNYWPRFTYSFGLIGLATYGDNDRASDWMNYFRHQRWPVEKGFLDFIAKGGGWPEGIVYDAISNYSRMQVLDAWKMATGENLFKSSEWFSERFGNLMLQHWPGSDDEWGNKFHPYASNGDYERGRGTMDSYWKIAAWILVEEFPELPLSQQLRSYLSAPFTAQADNFIQHAEFLWFEPDGPSAEPTIKSHFDRSLGNVYLRSGWPDGAADLDQAVTHINFRCGDFYTYHQHLDQNAFILYKHAPLALDSGIYSGNGLSHHDKNYYIRTIAHNTLVVYNKDEDFRNTRQNTSSNDGGQRPMKPATRGPESLAAYERNKKYYETGNILAYRDEEDFSYILGDATKAYNSVLYHQSSDTDLKNNIAKIKLFQREFLYLRPTQAKTDDYVVIYDRVAVTKPEFSGENTKLLFHIQNKPTINQQGRIISTGEELFSRPNQVTSVNGDGKLVIFPLLPKNLNVRVVGGLGEKANWVFGKNYNWHWGEYPGKPDTMTNYDEVPYGLWRIEVEPGDNKLEHNFLTVLLPTHKNNDQIPEITTITENTLEGVHISDKDLNRVALFHKMSAQNNAVDSLSFTYNPTTETTSHQLFGLTPDTRYDVVKLGKNQVKILLIPAANGIFSSDKHGILTFTL